MERTDEYRKVLDVPVSELSIGWIIEEICRQPENSEALYRLTTDEKLSVSWRALWVCDKLCRQYPDWFAPLREELTGRLVTCKHDGSKRLFFSILYHAPAEEVPSVELLNFCPDYMLSRHESIGVQSLAVRTAYHLCKHEPELLDGLWTIPESTDTELYSTVVKMTVRNILKKMNQKNKKKKQNVFRRIRKDFLGRDD